MEAFLLYDDNRVSIPVLNGLQAGYAKEYSLPDAVQCHAYYGKFPMLFQAVRCGRYEIAISDYLVNTERKVSCKADVICLELHFILKRKVLFNLKDLGWQELDELHHNMIALSKVKNEVYFKIIPVSTFDIHFSVEDVALLSKKYPQLRLLLKALETESYASLFTLPENTTPAMLLLIVKIKEAIKTGKAGDAATIEMIEKLIVLVLENEQAQTRYKYDYGFVEKVYKAAVRMEQHFDEKAVISNQLKQRNLKPDKFREIFRLMFGCLPSEYLQEKKIEKADWLIKEKRFIKPADIATLCAYKSVRHLSDAYYRKYHITLQKAIAVAKNSV